jgi:hypothetical protein
MRYRRRRYGKRYGSVRRRFGGARRRLRRRIGYRM